jgi:predicted DNA-binding protein (MmcQ/YjbR family)
MDILQLREYCLAKKHTTESFPFGPQVLVFKVGGKMFALVNIDNQDPSVNLKCDPEHAVELRERHTEIEPGYHMNKTLWNTVSLVGALPDKFICELIDHSYTLIIESLPKKVRAELG